MTKLVTSPKNCVTKQSTEDNSAKNFNVTAIFSNKTVFNRFLDELSNVINNLFFILCHICLKSSSFFWNMLCDSSFLIYRSITFNNCTEGSIC